MMRYFIVSICGLLLLFASALTKEKRHQEARATSSVPQTAGFPGVMPVYRPGAR